MHRRARNVRPALHLVAEYRRQGDDVDLVAARLRGRLHVGRDRPARSPRHHQAGAQQRRTRTVPRLDSTITKLSLSGSAEPSVTRTSPLMLMLRGEPHGAHWISAALGRYWVSQLSLN